MWIARDKSGKLYLFTSFPERYETEWNTGDWKDQIEIPGYLYPDLSWTSEPLEVSLYSEKELERIKSDAVSRYIGVSESFYNF